MSTLLLAWALLAAGFSLVTAVRVLLRPRRETPRGKAPAVLLLRPVDAPTAQEIDNLCAPIDYDGPIEHVVLSPYRPRLKGDVRWLASDPLSENRKVGHLLYGLSTLDVRGKVVLTVDADVRVDGALVRGLAQPIASGQAVLSTAAPRMAPGTGFAARATHGLLTHSHHSFVALHAMSAGAPAVCGKALGLSSQAQALLPELAEHIGEDLELSQRLHAQGGEVALSPAPAHVPASGPVRFEEAVERFTRWMQVLRAHRPALYPTVPLLFVPTLPLVVGALLLPSIPVLAAVGALLVSRFVLAWALERRGAADWILGELLLLTAFAASLRRRRVTWRGRTFELEGGGRMHAVPCGGRQ